MFRVISLSILIQKLLNWRIIQHCDIGHFAQSGSFLWKNWSIFMKVFIIDVSLDTEVPTQFWKSSDPYSKSGSGLRARSALAGVYECACFVFYYSTVSVRHFHERVSFNCLLHSCILATNENTSYCHRHAFLLLFPFLSCFQTRLLYIASTARIKGISGEKSWEPYDWLDRPKILQRRNKRNNNGPKLLLQILRCYLKHIWRLLSFTNYGQWDDFAP